MQSVKFEGHGNIAQIGSLNGQLIVTFADGHVITCTMEELSDLHDVQRMEAHAAAMAEWRLRLGWLGLLFDWITRGWWARRVLCDPPPSPPETEG